MSTMLFDTDRMPDFETTIPHRNWEIALQELFAAIVCAKPGELIEVVGPSRAGKSFLIKTVQEYLIDKETIADGEQPIVTVLAGNDGHQGSFDSKEFALGLLEAINHPLYSQIANIYEEEERKALYSKTSESLLKRVFINGIRNRRTRYLFIDEAQLVRFATKMAKAPTAIVESWKAMAETVGFVLIVIGTYSLIPIIQRSAHLLARMEQIHFPRYQWTENESKIFAEIVATYGERISSKGISHDLMNNIPMLYRATFGCVGLLNRLLRTASTRALLRGCPIDSQLVYEVMLSSKDLEIFSMECLEGENLLVKETFSPPEDRDPKQSKSSTSKAKTTRPFQRKPENMQKGHRSTKERGRND